MVFPLPCAGQDMFIALIQCDESGKTPLELAIENNHLWYLLQITIKMFEVIYSIHSILHALQERIASREFQPSSQREEEGLWDKLWMRMGPDWLLHACSHGSIDAVKFFIQMGCSPNCER